MSEGSACISERLLQSARFHRFLRFLTRLGFWPYLPIARPARSSWRVVREEYTLASPVVQLSFLGCTWHNFCNGVCTKFGETDTFPSESSITGEYTYDERLITQQRKVSTTISIFPPKDPSERKLQDLDSARCCFTFSTNSYYFNTCPGCSASFESRWFVGTRWSTTSD